MKRIIFSLLFLCFISISFSQNRFSNDVTLRKIYGFEYERQSDSLLVFLKSDNQIYRYAAIQGMASVQDTITAQLLLQMLAAEKVDSLKLALIYSLSQLDCNASFNGLLQYEKSVAPSFVKWACLEAIGKVCKQDVTEFYNQSFTANAKPDNVFLSNWLKGLYLAKRRKQVDLNKENGKLTKLHGI
jgi:hypothetical protein